MGGQRVCLECEFDDRCIFLPVWCLPCDAPVVCDAGFAVGEVVGVNALLDGVDVLQGVKANDTLGLYFVGPSWYNQLGVCGKHVGVAQEEIVSFLPGVIYAEACGVGADVVELYLVLC